MAPFIQKTCVAFFSGIFARTCTCGKPNSTAVWAFQGRYLIVVGARLCPRPRFLARRDGRGQARAPTGNVFSQIPTFERVVWVPFFRLHGLQASTKLLTLLQPPLALGIICASCSRNGMERSPSRETASLA